MMVSNKGSLAALLWWQKNLVLLFVASAVAAVLLVDHVGVTEVKLPTMPVAVVGAALGIFVSFRTNSAYDRWWEGRKLWGKLINVSRMFASQAMLYVAPADREAAVRLVHRHVAYVHALRRLLRLEDAFTDERFMNALPDDPEPMRGQSNLTHLLLHKQLEDIVALDAAGKLSEFRTQSFDRSIMTLLDVQGGCERIKKTPFPRGYTFIAQRLITAYGILFPLALVDQLGWLTVPINVLVCLSFALISEAGRVLEDPFNMFWNGLPLTNMSVTIERNVRERVGESELPEIPGPNERGILM